MIGLGPGMSARLQRNGIFRSRRGPLARRGRSEWIAKLGLEKIRADKKPTSREEVAA
jgi:hypothetical protein